MATKYNLFEIAATAKMNEEGIVIVEGRDDYQIYKDMCRLRGFKAEVYQVDEFEDFESGCRGVIRCMEILQPVFEGDATYINRIVGIVDRDSRFYRKELPVLKGLFVTKYYSIETYFATKKNLIKLLNAISYSTESDLGEDARNFLTSPLESNREILYLFSLEALKKAIDENYQSLLSYEYEPEHLFGKEYLRQNEASLRQKNEELHSFAREQRISTDDLKQIAKGKWYLYWFLYETFPQIQKLKEKCQRAEITQCRSCKVGNDKNCLFALRNKSYKAKNLFDTIFTKAYIDEEECEDIFQALQNVDFNHFPRV